MPEDHPKDFVVVGLDIISYSEKSLLQQKMAQERIDTCFNEALNQAKPKSCQMPHWIDAGDGGYALFDWAELSVLSALKEFYRRIDRHNVTASSDNDKVLVRSAIHKDKVVVWDTRIGGRVVKKFTGHAINNCARLMAGMIKEHKRQVICSRPVLDAFMLMDRAVAPTRLRDVVDKHNHTHEVWNIRDGELLGEKPLDKELHPEPFSRVYPGATK